MSELKPCPNCNGDLKFWRKTLFDDDLFTCSNCGICLVMPIKKEGDQKINIEIKEGGRYYEWNDGFCDYYINEKTGERKFKLDPEDKIVEHKFDDFER